MIAFMLVLAGRTESWEERLESPGVLPVRCTIFATGFYTRSYARDVQFSLTFDVLSRSFAGQGFAPIYFSLPL